MASLTSSLARTRRAACLCLLALLACAFPGMARKPLIIVRFYGEANKLDSNSFAKPITIGNPPREAYIERVPSINEKKIKAVYPFKAPDDSWGCTFALDNSGRIDLEVLSTRRRGTILCAFVGTDKGAHLSAELTIDKSVRDGIITIPNGLTELEIAAITKSWPVLGQKKRK